MPQCVMEFGREGQKQKAHLPSLFNFSKAFGSINCSQYLLLQRSRQRNRVPKFLEIEISQIWSQKLGTNFGKEFHCYEVVLKLWEVTISPLAKVLPAGSIGPQPQCRWQTFWYNRQRTELSGGHFCFAGKLFCSQRGTSDESGNLSTKSRDTPKAPE